MPRRVRVHPERTGPVLGPAARRRPAAGHRGRRGRRGAPAGRRPAGLTARVAAAVAGAAGGDWLRLKACEAEDCRWVYHDRSPAGLRRWCSMSVCGARAKMRTYRAKRDGTN